MGDATAPQNIVQVTKKSGIRGIRDRLFHGVYYFDRHRLLPWATTIRVGVGLAL
jgi:hypothetical protein